MKILYLTHCNWNSIKQRHHFLSENLNTNKTQTHVLYKWSPKKYNYTNNKTKIKLFYGFFFPFFLITAKFFFKIDTFIWNAYINFIQKKYKYNFIIVSHPLLYRYVEKVNTKIIYDCCDDNELFYKKSKLRKLINLENRRLLKNSDLNIFSSNNLLEKYKKYNQKNIVIRNAHLINFYKKQKKRIIRNENQLNIFYFGTISNWFDRNLIVKILKKFKNVYFTFIGPVDSKKIIHERVKYIGSMDHKKLMDFSYNADAFILPFKVNNLIKSVDPVKLYEYLFFNVPVISVYYSELIYFKKYIKLYKNDFEAFQIIKKIIKNNKINKKLIKKRKIFLKENSWTERSKRLINILEKI